MAEVIEVIRKEGETFITFFNNTRVGKCSEENIKQLQLRKLNIDNVPFDSTLVYAKK